jgi:hypothetical protein
MSSVDHLQEVRWKHTFRNLEESFASLGTVFDLLEVK